MPDALPPGFTETPIKTASLPPKLPPGYSEEPVSRSIGQPAKSQEPGMIDQLASLSAPPKNWSDVASKAKTVLHVVPYVAAATGPEGVAAGAAVQGLAGAAEEFGVQSIDKMNGKRQEYDWPAIGWNAGFNSAFSLLGGVVGKGISWMTGAGSVEPGVGEVGHLLDQRATVTPKSARILAQGAKDEVEAKTALDSLGTRLGMTEEQSAKMVGAYDEGRQVGDAVFKADRQVQGEFGKRYDAIFNQPDPTEQLERLRAALRDPNGKITAGGLGDTHSEIYRRMGEPSYVTDQGYVDSQGKWLTRKEAMAREVPGQPTTLRGKRTLGDSPIDMEPIRDSVGKSIKWLKDTGNEGHVRPGILKQLQEIVPEQPQVGTTSTGEKVAMINGRWMPVTDTAPTVTMLRGKVSELSALERTKNLTDVEESVIAQTRRTLTRSIAGALKAKDPQGAMKLAATDADYSVFKSNFRTFWRALKDKKSLSEVSDAIYDQLGKRPDSLRYVLSAADRAGRMDDMRMAFLNKMWRESQVAGGPIKRADALNAFISKFAPGTEGQGILEMVLGKRPGVTDSVGTFTQRLSDMSRAQEVLKDPAFANRVRRVTQYRLIYGLAGGAGLGLGYGAMAKNPAKGLAVGIGFLAGIEGMNWVATNPALNREWVQWVTTNPDSQEFITRAAKLTAQAAKDGVLPQAEDNAAAPNSR